ncbi:MAG TPA: hypothetical protein VEI55_03505, partial [Candidatus Acidoferrum sp.]|nr:hypothetical protein [Candidatus Acidoferrum sp.]
LPLDFEEFGGLIEHRRYFCVLHRHSELFLPGCFYRASVHCDLMQIRPADALGFGGAANPAIIGSSSSNNSAGRSSPNALICVKERSH